MKNAASWNSLAAGGSSSSVKKTNAMQTFELYRKQAKEKEERVGEDVHVADTRSIFVFNLEKFFQWILILFFGVFKEKVLFRAV